MYCIPLISLPITSRLPKLSSIWPPFMLHPTHSNDYLWLLNHCTARWAHLSARTPDDSQLVNHPTPNRGYIFSYFLTTFRFPRQVLGTSLCARMMFVACSYASLINIFEI
jgi:hypothetical protein